MHFCGSPGNLHLNYKFNGQTVEIRMCYAYIAVELTKTLYKFYKCTICQTIRVCWHNVFSHTSCLTNVMSCHDKLQACLNVRTGSNYWSATLSVTAVCLSFAWFLLFRQLLPMCGDWHTHSDSYSILFLLFFSYMLHWNGCDAYSPKTPLADNPFFHSNSLTICTQSNILINS